MSPANPNGFYCLEEQMRYLKQHQCNAACHVEIAEHWIEQGTAA